MTRRRATGMSLMEVVIAFAVLTVIATSIVVVGADHSTHMAHSLERTTAAHAASGRLEALAAGGTPATGERTFELNADARKTLSECHGVERVRELSPGLLEVTVDVRWRRRRSTDHAHVEFTTLLAREDGAESGR